MIQHSYYISKLLRDDMVGDFDDCF